MLKIIRETRPRTELCRRLGITPQYASNIARGQPIGGTETLAQISARLGLSDDEIGASVREMYPEHFAHAPTSESAGSNEAA